MPTYQSAYTGAEIEAALALANSHPARTDNPHGVTLQQVGGSNDNLLINADFRNPVNQRNGHIVLTGVTFYSDSGLTTSVGTTANVHNLTYVSSTTYSFTGDGTDGTNGTTYYVATTDATSGYCGIGYTIDRWMIHDQNGKLIVSDEYIIPYVWEEQLIELAYIDYLRGRVVTLSVMLEDGGILSSTGTFPESGDNDGFGRFNVGEGFVDFTNTNRFRFYNVNIPIKAAKVEPGSVSTLANDPPADYATELLKCLRYYRLWTTEAARAQALEAVGLMRLASPTLGTINIGGTAYYYADAEL